MNPLKKFIFERAYKKKKAEIAKIYPTFYGLIVDGLSSNIEIEYKKSKYFLNTFLVENDQQELLDQWIKDSCRTNFGKFLTERRGPQTSLEKENLRGAIEYHLLMKPIPKDMTMEELWNNFPSELIPD